MGTCFPITKSLIQLPISPCDLCDDNRQLHARGLKLLLVCDGDVELLILNDNILRRVGLYKETGSVSRRRISFNNTLIDVFLHIHGQLLCFGVTCLELVILYWLLALHVTLRRLVANFELRNPYLLFSCGVAFLLGERIDRVLHIIVHG